MAQEIASVQPEFPIICPATLPEHVYCEIISPHLPTYKGDGVMIDFGQQTKAFGYNWLKDSEENKILFNSSIEALNYMTSRGWEFVQAYTSGEDNKCTHLLLRMATSQLTELQKTTLLAEPRARGAEKSDNKKR